MFIAPVTFKLPVTSVLMVCLIVVPSSVVAEFPTVVVDVNLVNVLFVPDVVIDVPDEPFVPLEPELPDEPFVPLLPLEPDEPFVPLDPDDPELPFVPLLPLEPEEPLVPLDPLEPELPLVPLLPLVPDVAAVYDVPFINNEPVTLKLPVT